MEILKKFSDRFNETENVIKASKSDIENLETEFGIRLPIVYKMFIMDFGFIWAPKILDIIVDNEIELNGVQEFWHIESIVFDKKNEWTSQLSIDLIPFASDCMGNIFGFLTDDLKIEKQNIPIYFFDHDYDTVEKIAESFSKWINEFNKI